MNRYDESRSLRRRHDDLVEAIGRLGEADDTAGAVRLVRTVTVSSYPTSGPVVVGCKRLDIETVEAEGAVPTLTPAGDVFYFLTLGSTPPDVGTDLLVELVGGFWVQR